MQIIIANLLSLLFLFNTFTSDNFNDPIDNESVLSLFIKTENSRSISTKNDKILKKPTFNFNNKNKEQKTPLGIRELI